MLTQLSTVKSRLAIAPADTTNDALLTSAIQAVGARFDKECNRILARTAGATHELDPLDTELLPFCYPIEAVSKWESKRTEAEGWQEILPAPDFLIRASCVVSLLSPIHIPQSALRMTYTGGYVLPGAVSGPGQTPLPDDLEQAAVEQVAFWFQKRDKLGLKNYWPSGATYLAFNESDLLRSVQAVLSNYTRMSL